MKELKSWKGLKENDKILFEQTQDKSIIWYGTIKKIDENVIIDYFSLFRTNYTKLGDRQNGDFSNWFDNGTGGIWKIYLLTKKEAEKRENELLIAKL